jgi:hypothetical protein
MSARHAYMAAAALLVAVVAVVNLTAPTATAFPESDAWAHVAALNEWTSNIGDPGHPHLAVNTPSVRYIPPFLPLAALSAAAGWSALTAFAISAIVAVTLLTAVLYGFYRMMFPQWPWAPLLGLGLTVFGWGLASPWSGLFELRSLVGVAGYPSAWGVVAGLAMVLAAARAAETRNPWWLIATALLSAIALLSHLAAAAFAYSVAVVVAVDRSWRSFIAPGVAAIAGIAAAFAWPFFSMADVVTHRVLFEEMPRLADQFYSPLPVLAMVAPALVGIYALSTLPAGRRFALMLGGVAMAAVWIINIWVSVPLGDRFLLFSLFYLHLAIVAWLMPLLQRTDADDRLAVVLRAIAAALIVGHVFLLAVDFGGRRITVSGISELPNSGQTGIVNQMEDIATAVPDDAIVMADDLTGFVLPAFSGKVAATRRDTFGVDDAEIRVADAGEFFAAATSRQRRADLLDAYGATLILFAPEKAGEEVTADLLAMGRVAVATPFFTLVAPDSAYR